MQTYPVKLNGCHSPPALNCRRENQLWNQIAPDERLFPGWNQEILFRFSQCIGQIHERPYQLAAGAGWPSGSQNFGRFPGLVGTRQANKIVAANEQRIGVEHLCAGRSIVHIIQPHQGVAQKWRQQSAHIVQLPGICGGAIDQRAEVYLALHFDVLLRPVAKAQRIFFHAA